MESSGEMVAFPLLITPIENNYRACTIPYRFPSDNPKKPTPIELSWINLFANSIPSFKKRAESDDTVTDAPAKAEKFAQRYAEILEDFKKDPESHGGPPDCILLCRIRELILREVGFRDIFKKVKDEENAKAITLFKDVVNLNDAIEEEPKRVENLVRGIFAGNIFDLGFATLAELFSKDLRFTAATKIDHHQAPDLSSTTANKIDHHQNRLTSSQPPPKSFTSSPTIKMPISCCTGLLHFFLLLSSTLAHDPIISRFQQYLQINTAHPAPNYHQAADFILSQAKSLSLQSQTIEFAPNKPLILLKWTGKNPTLPSILLNSHTDVVPVEPHKWSHPPFDAAIDAANGNIYARGSQDMKCVGLQYLEAIRNLKRSNFEPLRTIYISFVPDEEIGGHDGAERFANSKVFDEMNVGIVLDEGLASPDESYRVFYAERCPMWLVIKAAGAPGHGAKLYDNTAMENLLKSIESVRRFRASQFDLVKAGLKAEGEVISVNMVFLKARTPSPTGYVMNLQPSEAQAGFDIRIPPIADQASLERRIAEEWAPASRNMTFEFKQKVSVYDENGRPILTAHDGSNPWWGLLEGAIHKANRKFRQPEIFPASTDARYFRLKGVPAIGFSPMANTPILLHDHNEFLNKEEYLKGIEVYESILKAFASFAAETENNEATKDEL